MSVLAGELEKFRNKVGREGPGPLESELADKLESIIETPPVQNQKNRYQFFLAGGDSFGSQRGHGLAAEAQDKAHNRIAR